MTFFTDANKQLLFAVFGVEILSKLILNFHGFEDLGGEAVDGAPSAALTGL